MRAFVSDLRRKKVSASTQTVVLSALLFLYREVLKKDPPLIEGIERAKGPERLPVVFTQAEVREMLTRLDGVTHLIAALLPSSAHGPTLLLLQLLPTALSRPYRRRNVYLTTLYISV